MKKIGIIVLLTLLCVGVVGGILEFFYPSVRNRVVDAIVPHKQSSTHNVLIVESGVKLDKADSIGGPAVQRIWRNGIMEKETALIFLENGVQSMTWPAHDRSGMVFSMYDATASTQPVKCGNSTIVGSAIGGGGPSYNGNESCVVIGEKKFPVMEIVSVERDTVVYLACKEVEKKTTEEYDAVPACTKAALMENEREIMTFENYFAMSRDAIVVDDAHIYHTKPIDWMSGEASSTLVTIDRATGTKTEEKTFDGPILHVDSIDGKPSVVIKDMKNYEVRDGEWQYHMMRLHDGGTSTEVIGAAKANGTLYEMRRLPGGEGKYQLLKDGVIAEEITSNVRNPFDYSHESMRAIGVYPTCMNVWGVCLYPDGTYAVLKEDEKNDYPRDTLRNITVAGHVIEDVPHDYTFSFGNYFAYADQKGEHHVIMSKSVAPDITSDVGDTLFPGKMVVVDRNLVTDVEKVLFTSELSGVNMLQVVVY